MKSSDDKFLIKKFPLRIILIFYIIVPIIIFFIKTMHLYIIIALILIFIYFCILLYFAFLEFVNKHKAKIRVIATNIIIVLSVIPIYIYNEPFMQ